MTTTAAAPKPAVLLVGHGVPARDTPRALIEQLRRLEGQRRATGAPPSAQELALDTRVRDWPRSPENDPYREGILALARLLARDLPTHAVHTAYNEFCAPSLDAAVRALAEAGVTAITVITTMVTEGGIHAERDLPDAIAALRLQYPHLSLIYAWPFPRESVGALLAAQVLAVKSA